jgi:hypothetical protein
VNRSSRVLYGEDMLPAEASTFERAGAGMTTLVISSPLDREDLRAVDRDNHRALSSKNSKANRIETGERSSGIRRNLFGESRRKIAKKIANWPAPGSEDTELGVSMEPEVDHGEAEVHTRVQA